MRRTIKELWKQKLKKKWNKGRREKVKENVYWGKVVRIIIIKGTKIYRSSSMKQIRSSKKNDERKKNFEKMRWEEWIKKC